MKDNQEVFWSFVFLLHPVFVMMMVQHLVKLVFF